MLVDGLWRGVLREETRIDEWMREVAPSSERRRWFHPDRSRWAEFRRRYLAELEQHPQELGRLARRAERERVTLVFAPRDEERNNAVVLKEYGVAGGRLTGRGDGGTGAGRGAQAKGPPELEAISYLGGTAEPVVKIPVRTDRSGAILSRVRARVRAEPGGR